MENSELSPTHHHSPIKSWIIWGLSCVFYFYECLLQVSPSVMSNELMHDFNVTGHTLGILSGIYFYAYAAMQLPCGMLLDYLGPRRLLTLATLLCAVSTIAFGLTTNFHMACLARLLMGLGSAFAAVGTMKLSVSWFSSDRFAFLTGLMVTIGMLGAIGGETPLALLVDHYGWRVSMMIMGFIGLFIAILIAFVITDAPKALKNSKTKLLNPEEPIYTSLKSVLRNKQIWFIALYGGLMYMATPVFCGLWGVPFLMFKMHVSKAIAANYISLIFIGWAIASPFWGDFSNRIGRRKPSLYIGCIMALILSSLFIFAPVSSSIVMQILLFSFGLFSAGFLPAFALVKEHCQKHYVATGLSFMNMMNMIGIAMIQPAIGYILDAKWEGVLNSHHVRVYPLSAYSTALALLPLGMLIALILLPRIRESYCKPI
jgi:MFS family permease